MPLARRGRRRTLDIWPGFVDALSTLLMVISFVLMVFVLDQYFLGSALSGSQQANLRLAHQLAELTGQLSLEQKSNASLHSNLSVLSQQLQSSTEKQAALSHDVAALEALKAELEAKISTLNSQLGTAQGKMQKMSVDAEAERALLSQQINALKTELAKVAAALDVSNKTVSSQKVEISTLGAKLNMALANKVEELKRYRSEFVGKLREVLGNRPGIRVEGDRFVFQAELLFPTGSAQLQPGGVAKLAKVATIVKELDKEIPKTLPWILRVDGFTDKRPISNSQFKSNWELSTARAITVVRALMADGVPPKHLAAAGFGKYHPVDTADTPAAYARNRRIELRLDQP
jgi:chemotaxis protein MotB